MIYLANKRMLFLSKILENIPEICKVSKAENLCEYIRLYHGLGENSNCNNEMLEFFINNLYFLR